MQCVRILAVAVLGLTACGDEEDKNVPPPGNPTTSIGTNAASGAGTTTGDGTTTDSTTSDGTTSDGTTSDGTTSDGTTSNGTTTGDASGSTGGTGSTGG